MKIVKISDCYKCNVLIWDDYWDCYICPYESVEINQPRGELKWFMEYDNNLVQCNKDIIKK